MRLIMLIPPLRHWLVRRRLATARAWQEAARAQAAEHDAAIRRILQQAAWTDNSGRRHW